jgi:hypothetical protein
MGKMSNLLRECIWSDRQERLWMVMRLVRGERLDHERQSSGSLAEALIQDSQIRKHGQLNQDSFSLLIVTLILERIRYAVIESKNLGEEPCAGGHEIIPAESWIDSKRLSQIRQIAER